MTKSWPCLIADADFSQNTVTLAMQCTDYKVSAGKHWLSTIPSQTEQEPVAWMNDEMDCIFFDAERPEPFDFDFWKPLYTNPPQRKPLTLHELSKIFASIPSIPFDGDWQLELVRAVEAAHGIKE